MSHSGHGRATPQGYQGCQGPDFGAHTQAQGTAGHAATATATTTTTHASGGSGGSGGPSTRSRRTNQRTGPSQRTDIAPYTVPSRSRFASVGPEPPNAQTGHRCTDGTVAWDGYSPAAVAHQGASAASTTTNFAPPLLLSTTTPWPVASTGGPLDQLDILQGAYPPYQGSQPGEVAAYDTGSASAQSSQDLAQIFPSLDASNQTHQPPFDVGPAFALPLWAPGQGDSAQLCICKGDHWLARCNRVWDHYNVAMLGLKCTCPLESLMNGEVPKDCPRAFQHLITLMPDNIALPPIQLPEALSAPSTRTAHLPFTPLLTHETSPLTQDIFQPSDVSQNLGSFDSHHAPLGRGSYPVPVLPSLPVDPSDTVTRSSPSCRGTLPNHRKASRDTGNPPAKRSRRAPQPKVTGNTGATVDPENVSLGFGSLDHKPKIQKAMRALFALLLKQKFVEDNTHEPVLGHPKGDGLLARAVAPDGSSPANVLPPDKIWDGYGTKGRSIYSVFIKVDGNEFKCLGCDDVQMDKLPRALRHFRAQHLRHKPFLCGEIHAGTGDTKACEARFASKEEMDSHKRRKNNPKTFHCGKCGNPFPSSSNRNRHAKKCEILQALTAGPSHDSDSNGVVTGDGLYEYGHDDDEYRHDDDRYGHDGDEYGHDDGDDDDDDDDGHDDDLYC